MNPADWAGMSKILPAPSKVAAIEHHSALPVDNMHGFMLKLRAAEGQGARALEFTILAAARSGEVRGATWSEIDLDAKTWTIPAARMKGGRDHRVPLSIAAVKLRKALPQGEGAALVFPSGKGLPLSDMTLSAVMRRMEVGVTVHGFRSTFRDWTAERTNYPNEMAEMALAHKVADKTEEAYRRGDMLARRAKMMDDWSAFIDTPVRSGNVVQLAAVGG